MAYSAVPNYYGFHYGPRTVPLSRGTVKNSGAQNFAG